MIEATQNMLQILTIVAALVFMLSIAWVRDQRPHQQRAIAIARLSAVLMCTCAIWFMYASHITPEQCAWWTDLFGITGDVTLAFAWYVFGFITSLTGGVLVIVMFMFFVEFLRDFHRRMI